jgi:hypothetical protein
MAASPSTVLTSSFINYSGKLIDVGSCFYAEAWGLSYPKGINSCFLWHLERGRTGKMVLVAEGIKKRVPLTMDLTWRLIVYTPAPGLTWADFPEEWSWWRAHGWGVLIREVRGLTPDEGHGYELQAYNAGRVRGFYFCRESWELFQHRPDALKRLLGEVLYYTLHYRKAAAFGTVGDQSLPNEVYHTFVEKMRRKMKKLGVS